MGSWLSLSFKNVFRNKRRSLLSLLSVGLVGFASMMIMSVSSGVLDEMIANFKAVSSGDITIQNKDYENFSIFNSLGYLIDYSDVTNKLKDVEGIKIFPRMDITRVTFYDNNDEMIGTKVSLVDASLTDDPLLSVLQVVGEGKLPQNESEIAISPGIAENYGYKVGDKIMLLSPTASRSTNGVSFAITAILFAKTEEGNTSSVYLAPEGINKLIWTSGIQKAIVFVDHPGQLTSVVDQITGLLVNDDNSKLVVIPWTNTIVGLLASAAYTSSLIVVTIFFCFGCTIIINTTVMAILERKKEISILRAMGSSQGNIKMLFFFEALFMGVMGSLSGVILGALVGLPFQYWGIAMPANLGTVTSSFYLPTRIYFSVTLQNMFIVFLISFLVSVIVSFIPLRRINKMKPADAFSS